MDLSKISDEKLALHMQQNGGAGIDEVIDRYQAKLLRYAHGILKDEDKAEDVVQESFISVYKNINSFDPKRKFSSWIYRIVHNRAISEVRKQRPVFGIELIQNTKDESIDGRMIEKEIDSKKAKEMIENSLEKIPVKYREVVYLRYFEDYSYEEISDILKIPKSTVGVRITRGLIRLKNILNINIEAYL